MRAFPLSNHLSKRGLRFLETKIGPRALTILNSNGRYMVVEVEGEFLRRLENDLELVQRLNHGKYLLEGN